MYNLQFIFPEIVLTIFAVAALMGSVFSSIRKLVGVLALAGVLIALKLFPASLQAPVAALGGMMVNDGFTVFFRTLILTVTAGVVCFSFFYRELDEENRGEFYFFILTLAVSMLVAVSTANLLMIYIALEAVSIISYILAGSLRNNILSSEAGIKYFLFGAFSTGVTLYGISLIYGLFGTFDLSSISSATLITGAGSLAVAVAFLLTLAGFAFKCSLAPFHMWAPDVYQGSPTPVVALFSVGPKAVGFAFILRLLTINSPVAMVSWSAVAVVMAILSMTIGNILAIRQTNLKRLLAYSSIAQAGYILAGLAAASYAGTQASLFYLFAYAVMNLGAFGAIILIYNYVKSDHLEDYAGLYKKDALTAIVLAVSLLSLAGIPPLVGFLAKFFILAAALEAKLFTLAIVASVNSVFGAYYYVKIIKSMFLEDPRGEVAPVKPFTMRLILALFLAGNVLLGIWPQPLLNWIAGLFS